MFPMAAVAAAGWLLLFIVLLVVPPSSGPRRGAGLERGTVPVPPSGGDEPQAVISLLAGRLDKLGFGVTLIDLVARGWFGVDGPLGPALAGPAGAWGPAGPAMCVVAAETPAGPLAPFERRVVAHVALRAGARGEVPAPALSDGFEGGETEFMKAFREEVDADARQRGLTRPRLSGRRIGLLCALLLIPAGALLIAVTAAYRHHALAYAGLSYLAGCWVTGGIGISRRRSAAGQEALDRWRSAVAGASRRHGQPGRLRRHCQPGRLRRRGSAAGLRGRPRGRARRGGGLRPEGRACSEDRCARGATSARHPNPGANGMARSRSGRRLSTRRQDRAVREPVDGDHQHPGDGARRQRSVAGSPAPAGRSAAPRARGPAGARARLRGLRAASFGLIDFNQY